MVCRTCGAAIADKAIACYRCGAATDVPVVNRSSAPTPRRWPLVIVMLVVAVALGWLAVVSPSGSWRQLLHALFGAVAAAVAGMLARPRGRR